MSGVMAIGRQAPEAASFELPQPIVSGPKKEKAPRFPGAPPYVRVGSASVAAPRTIVPVAGLALNALLEVANTPFEVSRLSRPDSVTRRHENPALEVTRLVIQRPRLAPRNDPASLECSNVGAQALDSTFH